MRNARPTVYLERAWLAAGLPPGTDTRRHDPLAELHSLAETAGAVVVGRSLQKLDRPHPRTYLGSGKVEEIAREVKRHKIGVVILDHDLSPSQVHNLESEIRTKVIDRTELILDIFATHARSGPAKLQVELAQLEYNLPRLRRMWTHLTDEQQAGGVGIGVRGPGEKQIEVDRRLARKRITDLKREIERLGNQKRREVEARAQRNFTVGLVGYTNAGKSTLMNALTHADVPVDDRLFSTLDTRTRIWRLACGVNVLLSDTVGFIRDLPHDLVASFHATLEEVSRADLLLHVVDAGHPESADQIAAVRGVLGELHCEEIPTLLVLNKIDRLRDPVEQTLLLNRDPGALLTSAARGYGLSALEERVGKAVTERFVELVADLPAADGRLAAEVADQGLILSREMLEEHVRIRAKVPRRLVWKLEPYLSDGSRAAQPRPA